MLCLIDLPCDFLVAEFAGAGLLKVDITLKMDLLLLRLACGCLDCLVLFRISSCVKCLAVSSDCFFSASRFHRVSNQAVLSQSSLVNATFLEVFVS